LHKVGSLELQHSETIDNVQKKESMLIQVAESDRLRDEDEANRRKLDEDGVKFTTVRYHGMIHDFGLLNGSAEEPVIHSLFEQAARECLGRYGRYRKEGTR
jgi:acetyl esterase